MIVFPSSYSVSQTNLGKSKTSSLLSSILTALLPQSFCDFFVNKISTIRDSLNSQTHWWPPAVTQLLMVPHWPPSTLCHGCQMILIATKTILNSVPQSVNLEGSDIKLPTHFASYVSVLISLFPTAVLCCICFQELHRISAICHYLSEDVTKKLLCVFVLSSLFYCNLLLAVYPNYFVSKLQKVQNNAARLIFRTFTSGHITRLIFRTFTSAHITPMLHSLHWLPIEQRIEYKLSLL